MAETFDYGVHFVVKAMRKAGIVFPITKAEALAKAGDIQVRVDFDKYASLYSIIDACVPEEYPNAESFYCAYEAAQMKQLKADIGY